MNDMGEVEGSQGNQPHGCLVQLSVLASDDERQPKISRTTTSVVPQKD